MRQKITGAMPRNSFVCGVFTLAGGTVGAQLIVIAASPLLTRLYTPTMFGSLAVFLGFATVLASLATWRYEISIPQADSEQAATNIAALCCGLTFFMFALSGFLVWLFQGDIVKAFQLQEIAQLIWLVPFFILFTGCFQLLTYWNYRQRQFAKVAQSTLGKNTGMTAVQLLSYPMGAMGLLVGQLAGQLLAVLLLLRSSMKLFQRPLDLTVLRHNAWRFRKYPLFSTWSGVTGSAAQQAPMLMFAALFSPVQAGLYSLAFRIVGMPGTLVGTAVANVFLPHAADAWRDGKLDELLNDVHRILAQLAAPVVIVLLIASPNIFALVFGSEWREAGHYAQWLAIMLYANFIYSPVSTAFGIMDRQDAGLVLHVALLVASVMSIWIGASQYQSTLVTVAFYSVANAILYMLALIWIHRQTASSISQLIMPILGSVRRALPIALPLLLMKWLILPLWATVILVAAAGVFTVLYYLPLLDRLRANRVSG